MTGHQWSSTYFRHLTSLTVLGSVVCTERVPTAPTTSPHRGHRLVTVLSARLTRQRMFALSTQGISAHDRGRNGHGPGSAAQDERRRAFGRMDRAAYRYSLMTRPHGLQVKV